ncbi:MAG: T9SS C-terminal target domain-containing protein [Crocinitomicaceae bacterium]|nr:T9SS C-terminal target domain-containing protein [Crocinitomicaceae bacterium]
MFDAMGKIVLNQTDLLVRNGLTTFTLNVINGIYFVNITNLSTHETTVKKLVVRK